MTFNHIVLIWLAVGMLLLAVGREVTSASFTDLDVSIGNLCESGVWSISPSAVPVPSSDV